jgi:hypothetical protein
MHRARSNVVRQDVWYPAHIRDTSFRGTAPTRTSRDPRPEPTPCRPRATGSDGTRHSREPWRPSRAHPPRRGRGAYRCSISLLHMPSSV